jgi:hypothetical protein
MSLNQSIRIRTSGNLYRCITELKKGYQLRANLVKDERDDLLADTHEG